MPARTCGRGTRVAILAGLLWRRRWPFPRLGKTPTPHCLPAIGSSSSRPAAAPFLRLPRPCGNTPFNASGTHVVLLETDFQDRQARKTDVAEIVLLDLATKNSTTLTRPGPGTSNKAR